MIRRLIKNEIKNQKLLSISTVIFMAVSSMLIVLALTLFSSLLGSVSNLMKVAGTPDYLQMHAGEINESELEAFAGKHGEIEAWQISRFLNLDNISICLENESLAGNTQDNGLCLQGETFDYILNMDNEIPEVHTGEVYVPVCYQSIYDLQTGDRMRIGEETLTIAGFIRDSQMNSMMASSKRFLVCEVDYERFIDEGSEEYLIEYQLEDGSDLDAFAEDYNEASLPANGPAITQSLIKLMNALSDGIMIFVIFLVGIAVLLISLLCIGYIASIGVERDRNEAGLLKALGIHRKQVRQIYMAKYLLFSVIGGITGFAGALLLSNPLSRSLKELYGASEDGMMTVILALIICVLIQSLILLFIRNIIKKNEKITVIEALFQTQNLSSKSSRGQMFLIGFVTAVCIMLALIPQNLYTTLSAPEFVSYMGIGKAQVRMDVRQSENIDTAAQRLINSLGKDENVQNYVALKTVSCPASVHEAEQIHLLVEAGNHSVFPVAYTEGREPVKADEIALSVLQAEDLGIGIGDQISFGKEKAIVCGLYSDITNGGKTAKMFLIPDSCKNQKTMWSIIYVDLEDSADKKQWMEQYKNYGADVVNISDYVNSTYGPTIDQVGKVKIIAFEIATLIIFVVLLLFVRLLIEKNRNKISLQKALGFRNRDIMRQYIQKAYLPVFSGVIAGAVLAMILGEKICGLALKTLGASGFRFVISPSAVMTVFGIMILTGFVAVFFGTSGIKNIYAYECCRGKE